ncbi:hypothetical protein [Methylobacterium sp. JK268]
MRLPLVVLLAVLPLPACGSEAECGGDAFSSAQVTEGRPSHSGPLTAIPDTLCADLSGTRRNRVRIDVYAPPDGTGTGGTPYEDRGSRSGPRRGDGSRAPR